MSADVLVRVFSRVHDSGFPFAAGRGRNASGSEGGGRDRLELRRSEALQQKGSFSQEQPIVQGCELSWWHVVSDPYGC